MLPTLKKSSIKIAFKGKSCSPPVTVEFQMLFVQTHNLSMLAELIIYASGHTLVSPVIRFQPPAQVISLFLIVPNIFAVQA